MVWGAKSGEELPINLFSEICNVEFENKEFFAMPQYDLYLRKMYGDYMLLPPVEKRISNHTFNAYAKHDI